MRGLAIGMMVMLWLGATGCVGQCLDEDGIVPGVGVAQDGESLCLGDAWETVDKRLGEADVTSDLQAAGVRLTWAAPPVVGHVSSQDEAGLVTGIQLGASVTARTPGGVGIGSDEAAVRSEFGEPVLDPMLGAWLYPGSGIAFQWSEGAVTTMHLSPPL